MSEKNVVTAIRDALHDEIAEDERVVLLGEDVGARGGVFRISDGWMTEFGEHRIIDTPLAESGIVGVAIGMALHGLLPIAEIQFADFIHPAFDQIVSEAARIRYRSNGDFGVPLVIRTPCGGGIHGALYHSQSIEAFYAHVPGLKVVMPATPADAVGLLRSAIRDPDPVLFLEHKKTYRAVKGDVPDGWYQVPIGVADVKREGEDLSVITYGYELHRCLEAAQRLQEDEGISVEVVDVRTIAPLDVDDDPRLRPQDVEGHGRVRGQPFLRGRGRDRRHDRGAGDVRSGCPDRADRGPGHPRDAVRRAPGALLHRAPARSPLPGDARAGPFVARERPAPGLRSAIQGPSEPVDNTTGTVKRPSRDPSERRTRPAGASRDLIWISVVALGAFSIGVAFDVFPRLHDRLERLSPIITDNLLAVLVILAAAFAVVSVRGLQRAEREASLREVTERRFRALVEQVPAITYTWNPTHDRGRGLHRLHQSAGGTDDRLHPRGMAVLAHVLERAHPLRRSTRSSSRHRPAPTARGHRSTRSTGSSRRTAGSSGCATRPGR